MKSILFLIALLIGFSGETTSLKNKVDKTEIISLPFELLFVLIFFMRLPNTPEGFIILFKSYRFHPDKAIRNNECKQ